MKINGLINYPKNTSPRGMGLFFFDTTSFPQVSLIGISMLFLYMLFSAADRKKIPFILNYFVTNGEKKGGNQYHQNKAN